MATHPDFRQQVSAFRQRINTLLDRKVDRRDPIDTTGSRSRDPGFRSDDARLLFYAERRYTSVARMCALLAIVRDTENLATRSPPVKVTSTGAYWQAFGGNAQNNACHTCPAFLLFDDRLPTQITANRGLQRHIVVEFADCMLMPKSINGIDQLVDEKLGVDAFVDAAKHMLHTADAGWRAGLAEFDRAMADMYANAHAVLFNPSFRSHQRNATEEKLLDVLCAYYEGLAASRENPVAIENFRLEVLREMNVL